MTTILYNVSQKWFGCKTKLVRNSQDHNQADAKGRLRRHNKETTTTPPKAIQHDCFQHSGQPLRKQYNMTASNIVKIVLQRFRVIGRQHLTYLRKAYNTRKNGKKEQRREPPLQQTHLSLPSRC